MNVVPFPTHVTCAEIREFRSRTHPSSRKRQRRSQPINTSDRYPNNLLVMSNSPKARRRSGSYPYVCSVIPETGLAALRQRVLSAFSAALVTMILLTVFGSELFENPGYASGAVDGAQREQPLTSLATRVSDAALGASLKTGAIT
jgi:hypothetical protein